MYKPYFNLAWNAESKAFKSEEFFYPNQFRISTHDNLHNSSLHHAQSRNWSLQSAVSFDKITGESTSIRSTSEGIITYRHQDHTWITSDHNTHILVKDPSQPNSLILYSNLNGENNWVPSFSLPYTRSSSTADGVLTNNSLFLSYSDTKNDIRFVHLQYDNNADSWQTITSSLVFQDPVVEAVRPTISLSSNNQIWISFITQNSFGESSIALHYADIPDAYHFNFHPQISEESSNQTTYEAQNTNNLSWQDINIDFGMSNTDRISSKVITLSDGVAIIFSENETLNWAYHANDWPIDMWSISPIYSYDGNKQADPKGAHFSAVVDDANNIHIATNNGNNRLIYIQYDDIQNSWQAPLMLTEVKSASYMQISVAEDNSIFITYDVRRTKNQQRYRYLEVIQSSDQEATFSLRARLLYRPTINQGNPRIESPAYIYKTLPVFQQIASSDNSFQNLVYFQVPTASH